MSGLLLDELSEADQAAIREAMALLDPYWRLMRVELATTPETES